MLRRIKKSLLQSPIVLVGPQFQTRLAERPYTITLLSPETYSLDKVQKFALGLLLAPAGICFLTSPFSRQWVLFFIAGFMLLLIGFILWILKLRSEMVWQVTWHNDAVAVVDGRYGPAEEWIEPLSAFTGLMQEKGYIRSVRQYNPGRWVYGLLLAHPDPFKSILLHTSDKSIADNNDIIAYYEAELGTKFRVK